MSVSRMTRLFVGALMLVGVLGGLNGGVTPPAAHAVPGGGSDPPDPQTCTPQQVNGDQAELVGYMYVVDPPMVGQPTRIRISNPTIEFPDPRCEGTTASIPVASQVWYVGARPAGSTAIPTQFGAEARLVADRPGAWTVVFTACPSGCFLRGVRVPPLSKDISFTAIPVVEGRVTDAFLYSTLNGLLAGTRIQISHTGNGTTVQGTPYTVAWRPPPAFKYYDLCVAPPQPAPICASWNSEDGTIRRTFRTITPQLTSYIDFGALAEKQGAPDNLPLPIPIVERDVPLAKRAAILAGQGGVGILVGLDIDRIRMLANNLNVDLSNASKRTWSIGGGSINLGLSLDSSNPSIKCEGHFKAKVGYVFTVTEGWADELCPDFNLGQMDLSVRLVPAVLDGMLTVGDAQVTVQLEPQGVQSELIDFFVGATTIAEDRIATAMRAKLLDDQTKTALGKVLTAALRFKFPDLCRVVTAQVVGSDLVIQYQAPPSPGLPCLGPGNAPPS